MRRPSVPAGLLLLLFLAGSPFQPAAVARVRHRAGCDLYAAPTGGTASSSLRGHRAPGAHAQGSRRNPFASPQRLVDSLRPGQTGCLLGGMYVSGSRLDITRGGAAGAPVRLMSVPGQRATLRYGVVHVLASARYVTLEGLDIDGSANPDVTVWVEGDEVRLWGDEIHNSNSGMSCVFAGGGGIVRISGNRIHNCGRNGNQDHALYMSDTSGSSITDNLLWGASGFAVHLYPHAQGTLVAHNVIDSNGYGVVFGGDAEGASSNNTVTQNVISNSSQGYLVQSSWDGPIGTGNTVTGNCLYHGALGGIETPLLGFAASANLTANPQYTDAANHTYTLRPTSRCLRRIGYDAARRIRSRGRR